MVPVSFGIRKNLADSLAIPISLTFKNVVIKIIFHTQDLYVHN